MLPRHATIDSIEPGLSIVPVLSALHVSPNGNDGNDGYDQEHKHNHYDGDIDNDGRHSCE